MCTWSKSLSSKETMTKVLFSTEKLKHVRHKILPTILNIDDCSHPLLRTPFIRATVPTARSTVRRITYLLPQREIPAIVSPRNDFLLLSLLRKRRRRRDAVEAVNLAALTFYLYRNRVK